MKRVTAVGLTAIVCVLMAAVMLAHEETYEGTVAAIKVNRYAASSEVIATLEVKISDLKRPRVFDITRRTRFLRDNSIVSFADALIQKDERVAVTANHDNPDEGAIEVRVSTQKMEGQPPPK